MALGRWSDRSSGFADAARDYAGLLDRGYAERPALALVGDRYQLSRDERMILFRAISPRDRAEARRNKLVSRPALRSDSSTAGTGLLVIDGYNILFTIYNYILGRPLFISMDGFLRDAGGSHGTISRPDVWETSIGIFVESLAILSFKEFSVFLDAPVSSSKEHARVLRERIGDCATVEVAPSADRALKDFAAGFAGETSNPLVASAHAIFFATSDSAIIDAIDGSFVDLARVTLENRFAVELSDISALL